MENNPEVKNAKIINTMLGFEDHGIFTFMLTLDYGGSCQGAGGYALGTKHISTSIIVTKILKTVGVDTWEDLKGKLIKVRADRGRVYAISHVLNDNWLDFEKEFNKINMENNNGK